VKYSQLCVLRVTNNHLFKDISQDKNKMAIYGKEGS